MNMFEGTIGRDLRQEPFSGANPPLECRDPDEIPGEKRLPPPAGFLFAFMASLVLFWIPVAIAVFS